MSLAQAAPEPHAGRMCPVDYHYPPAVFDRPPDIAGDTLMPKRRDESAGATRIAHTHKRSYAGNILCKPRALQGSGANHILSPRRL